MKTYALRMAETKRLAGVVRAATLVDLFDYVDEQDNPHAYEYSRIIADTPGGIVGSSPVGAWPPMLSQGWQTFEQLCGKPFAEWYAEDYIPSLPLPG